MVSLMVSQMVFYMVALLEEHMRLKDHHVLGHLHRQEFREHMDRLLSLRE